MRTSCSPITSTNPSASASGAATLTLHAPHGLTSVFSFRVAYTDASLNASGSNVTATSGALVTAPVATFVDTAPNDPVSEYSATVSWGDGSSSAGTVQVSAGG